MATFATSFNINPTQATQRALTEGPALNQRAIQMSNIGNHKAAAALHRQALEVKLEGLGSKHSSTAISYNALGEELTQLGQLDEAEEKLEKAVDISLACNPPMDQGVYRENLAIVHEKKGNLEKAAATRRLGKPDKVVCSNYNVRSVLQRLVSVLFKVI